MTELMDLHNCSTTFPPRPHASTLAPSTPVPLPRYALKSWRKHVELHLPQSLISHFFGLAGMYTSTFKPYHYFIHTLLFRSTNWLQVCSNIVYPWSKLPHSIFLLIICYQLIVGKMYTCLNLLKPCATHNISNWWASWICVPITANIRHFH